MSPVPSFSFFKTDFMDSQPLVPDLRVYAAMPDSELCSEKEKVWCVFCDGNVYCAVFLSCCILCCISLPLFLFLCCLSNEVIVGVFV